VARPRRPVRIGWQRPPQRGRDDDDLDGNSGVDYLNGSRGTDRCQNGETVIDLQLLLFAMWFDMEYCE
jgi:hypothetical protein